MEAVNSTKFSLQLYELIRSRTDESTAKKAVEAVKGLLYSKVGGVATNENLNLKVSGLETKIAETKSDIIKWLFGFCSIFIVIIGLKANAIG